MKCVQSIGSNYFTDTCGTHDSVCEMEAVALAVRKEHFSFTIVAHKIEFTSTTRCEPSEKLRFYASNADQMLNETLHEEAVANRFPSIQ